MIDDLHANHDRFANSPDSAISGGSDRPHCVEINSPMDSQRTHITVHDGYNPIITLEELLGKFGSARQFSVNFTGAPDASFCPRVITGAIIE